MATRLSGIQNLAASPDRVITATPFRCLTCDSELLVSVQPELALSLQHCEPVPDQHRAEHLQASRSYWPEPSFAAEAESSEEPVPVSGLIPASAKLAVLAQQQEHQETAQSQVSLRKSAEECCQQLPECEDDPDCPGFPTH